MRYITDTVFNASSSAGNLASAAIDATSVIMASLQAVFTDGASAGTLKFQFSNDLVSPATWSDVPSGSVAVTAGGTVLIQCNNICGCWLRVTFTQSAGAGTVTAKLKTIGY